jgi:hypothetical protein
MHRQQGREAGVLDLERAPQVNRGEGTRVAAYRDFRHTLLAIVPILSTSIPPILKT